MLLQKEENIHYIENLLSEIFGSNTRMSLIFEKKEDYLARKLGM